MKKKFESKVREKIMAAIIPEWGIAQKLRKKYKLLSWIVFFLCLPVGTFIGGSFFGWDGYTVSVVVIISVAIGIILALILSSFGDTKNEPHKERITELANQAAGFYLQPILKKAFGYYLKKIGAEDKEGQLFDKIIKSIKEKGFVEFEFDCYLSGKDVRSFDFSETWRFNAIKIKGKEECFFLEGMGIATEQYLYGGFVSVVFFYKSRKKIREGKAVKIKECKKVITVKDSNV